MCSNLSEDKKFQFQVKIFNIEFKKIRSYNTFPRWLKTIQKGKEGQRSHWESIVTKGEGEITSKQTQKSTSDSKDQDK